MVRFGAPTQTATAAVQASAQPTRAARARAAREGKRRQPAARRRRGVRPRLAPRRPRARPRRLHVVDRDRSKGTLLRPLRRSRDRHARRRTQGLPRQAHVLEDRRRRTSPSSTGSSSPRPTPRSLVTRAGSERRARQDARPARRSSRCSATSSSSGAPDALRFARQRQRRQRPRRRGRRHARPDRLRLRRARHRRAPRAARPRAGVARPRSSSPTSTPTTSAACRRSPRATAFRSGSRSARWPSSPERFDGMRARLRLRQPRRASRSATLEIAAVPGAARRARAGAVRGRRRRAAARRADRHRHVDARTSRRACPAATRWCSNATTTSTCSRTATIRARSSSASPGASATWTTRPPRRLLARIDTSRLEAHHRRAPVAAEQHAGARARGAGAALGCAPDWIGIADQDDGIRLARDVANDTRGRDAWKSGRSSTRQGEDGLRDRRSALSRHALPRRRVGVRRRQARQARAKGETNNKINAYVMGKLAAAGIATHFVRLLNERESLVKAMKMVPVECVVRNVCAGSMAKRYGIDEGTRLAGADLRVLPEERRAARSAVQRRSHPRAGLGERRRDRADEGADAQGQRAC